jgi:hypothetical protein
MAEYSWFWDGTATGDATLSPLTSDEFTDIWSALSQFDRRSMQAVFAKLGYETYSGSLEIHVKHMTPEGGVIVVDPGVAVIDGKAYRLLEGAFFTLPVNTETTTYYRIYLMRENETQTVRLYMTRDYVSQDFTTIEQSDSDGLWAVTLLTAEVSTAGVLTTSQNVFPTNDFEEIDYETRWFNSLPVVAGRKGGSATIWSTGGSTNYPVPTAVIEVGSIAVGANPTTVTLAQTFDYAPIVLLMPYDTGTTWSNNNMWVSRVTTTEFDVSFDATTNLDSFFYIAIGQIQ